MNKREYTTEETFDQRYVVHGTRDHVCPQCGIPTDRKIRVSFGFWRGIGYGLLFTGGLVLLATAFISIGMQAR